MIEEKIKDYFHRFSDLRILFFFDEEQEYLEEVKGLDLSDIHIEYWQNNPFSLKVSIIRRVKGSKVCCIYLWRILTTKMPIKTFH